MSLNIIPKLEELAETPAKAKDLPSDVRQTLAFRALAALNALYAAGLADGASGNSPVEHSGNGDRLLDVQEAARKLGKSKDHLYRHAGDYPFTVRDGRSLRFSELGIEKFIRQRMGR
jgi:predicted DNA-binding transcriptional regulator AlpA